MLKIYSYSRITVITVFPKLQNIRTHSSAAVLIIENCVILRTIIENMGMNFYALAEQFRFLVRHLRLCNVVKITANTLEVGQDQLTVSNFDQEYFQPACAVSIQPVGRSKQDITEIKIFRVEFRAVNTCSENVTLSLASGIKMCSSELHNINTKIIMTKCCNDTDFCNFDLRPTNYSPKFNFSVRKFLFVEVILS